MNADLYSQTGEKKGTVTLPASLFEAPINGGLMHQAVVRQLSGARASIAHTKSRGEIRGSTRKLYAQKGTGRARRGPIRSPLLRGGNKAFGPKSNASFTKEMPRAMRRVALISCLSLQANRGTIVALEGFSGKKTKEAALLLQKLPLQLGRKLLVVTGEHSENVIRAMRNIPRLRVVSASYLNPVDVLGARKIIFFTAALKRAEELFGSAREWKVKVKEMDAKEETKAAPDKKTPRAKTSKPAACTKRTAPSSASSVSSDSSASS